MRFPTECNNMGPNLPDSSRSHDTMLESTAYHEIGVTKRSWRHPQSYRRLVLLQRIYDRDLRGGVIRIKGAQGITSTYNTMFLVPINKSLNKIPMASYLKEVDKQ